jgi:hypothetical protein
MKKGRIFSGPFTFVQILERILNFKSMLSYALLQMQATAISVTTNPAIYGIYAIRKEMP